MKRMLAVGTMCAVVGMITCFVTPVMAQTYDVTVITSALSGQPGNIDLQFNPGGADALASNVVISNFSTDGTVDLTAMDTGGASGSLPSTAAISNSSSFNDLFQGITYGNNINFDATFSGPALSPTAPFPSSGSTFALSLYDSTGTIPLETIDPGGSVLDININPDGSFTVTNFPSDQNGSPPVASTVPASMAEVPEPGAGIVLGAGLIAITTLIFIRRHFARCT